MFSKNYIEYVKKTANPCYTVEMAACALLEEWLEFCKDDSLDELGDVYYQFVLFAILTGSDMKFDYDDECEEYDSFVKSVLNITTQYKKFVTRGKRLNLDTIKRNLDFIYSDIKDATTAKDVSCEAVESYNMQKLNERYKNVSTSVK